MNPNCISELNLACRLKSIFKMEQQKNAYPTLPQSFGIVGMIFLFSLILGMPVWSLGKILELVDLKSPTVDSAISLCLYVSVFCLTYRYATRKSILYGGNVARLSYRSVPRVELIFCIVLPVALKLFIDPVTELIPSVEVYEEIMSRMIRPNVFSFLTVVIAAPILEELIFRGIILDGFLKRYSPVKAILLSSLLFGLIHINPSQVVFASLMGLMLGWIYWKTGSLLLSVFIHFVNNGLAYMLILILDNPNASLYQTVGSNSAIYGFVVLCAGGILAMAYWYFQNRYKQVNV